MSSFSVLRRRVMNSGAIIYLESAPTPAQAGAARLIPELQVSW